MIGFRRVLAVAGEIDCATILLLRDALDELVHSSGREVWVDLTDVEFMDSTGVHALLEARAQLARDGRRLAVIAPPGPARRALQVAGVDGEFAVFAERNSAHRAS